MLRLVAQRTLPLAQLQHLGSTCAFATAASKDYSMVMRQAEELASTASIPDEELNQVGYTYGVPEHVMLRKAHISCSSRTASQQGQGKSAENENSPNWKINFDLLPKWQNPLIGWTSSNDCLENVGRSSLMFYSKEEAIAFCKKSGWEYDVAEPALNTGDRPKRYHAYGDNYSVKRGGTPKLATRWANSPGGDILSKAPGSAARAEAADAAAQRPKTGPAPPTNKPKSETAQQKSAPAGKKDGKPRMPA